MNFWFGLVWFGLGVKPRTQSTTWLHLYLLLVFFLILTQGKFAHMGLNPAILLPSKVLRLQEFTTRSS